MNERPLPAPPPPVRAYGREFEVIPLPVLIVIIGAIVGSMIYGSIIGSRPLPRASSDHLEVSAPLDPPAAPQPCDRWEVLSRSIDPGARPTLLAPGWQPIGVDATGRVVVMVRCFEGAEQAERE